MFKAVYSKIWGNIFQMQKLLSRTELILLHHKFYFYLHKKNIINAKLRNLKNTLQKCA